MLSKKKIAIGLIGLILNIFNLSHAKEFLILDVRTPVEFNDNHLVGAMNIDFLSPTFKGEVEKLDKNKVFKIYCRSGNRSGKALGVMRDMGFKDLENLGSLTEASRKLNIRCAKQGPC
ncbi:MAG: hypothetical protein RJB66_1186 [Pseudomonadota bacterium]|jgi:rhodanese-related sulfurtransferase